MKITVILCTYNRSQSLVRALESTVALELSHPDQCEVLVVDNNSTDNTREVVEDFCRRYPGRFRYLFEARQGKSHALNSGIQEAYGDVLAFIDDDVTVEPDWLRNLTASLRDGDWAGSGGPVLPEQFTPPHWLLSEGPHALAPLVFWDLGPKPIQLTEPPVGTNMAFRREVFTQYGGFRTDLGPHPNSHIRGEDTEFGARLLACGLRLRYEPAAKVYHVVPPNRLTKDYFLAWWFDKSRADIRAFGIPEDTKWQMGSIPLVLFRRLTVWTMRWLLTFNPARRFYCKMTVWNVAGRIVESYRRPRHALPKTRVVEQKTERTPVCASEPQQSKR